jgi:glycerol-3-phosphate acyltransferase PlsY
MLTLIAMVAAYLIGSLSSAVIVAKIMGLPDPRTQGSGNAGATNMLRVGGKKNAAIVMVGDVLKGVIAVVIGRAVGLHGFELAVIAFLAILGHIFPVFFQFKGGKGVATMLGCLFVLNPILGLLSAIVWLAVAYFSKYASLASIIAVIASAFLSLLVGHATYFIPLIFCAALVVYKHKENIERLKAGTESKINLKK